MTLQELRKTMMLAKKDNPEKSTVLAMLLDAAQKIAKADNNRTAEEKDIIIAAKKELKMAHQSQDAGIEIGNTIEYIQAFIPATMDEEQTREIITAIVSDLTEKSPQAIGKVMGVLRKEYGDKIDMGLASQITKDALSLG